MSAAFVWFHNNSNKPDAAVGFYEKLLGWQQTDGPAGMTMFAGESGPFAGVGEQEGKVQGWVPYVQVDDVDDAAQRAGKLGAEVLQPRTKGPAGDYTVIRDPGGATLALWQKA